MWTPEVLSPSCAHHDRAGAAAEAIPGLSDEGPESPVDGCQHRKLSEDQGSDQRSQPRRLTGLTADRCSGDAPWCGLQLENKRPSEDERVGLSLVSLSESVVPIRARLTERQLSILALAAAGLSDKEVAARAQISERTVRFHFANIRARLGAVSRTQAVAMAVSRRMVTVRHL